MSVNKSVSFPDRAVSDSEKAKPEYGLQFFKAAYSSFAQGDNSYYSIRNRRILENRLFARGDQPEEPLLDLMGIDGKAAYINIDFTPSPIAPKFKNVFVDGYMVDKETIKAVATDRTILTKKERKKLEAEFRAKNKEFVDELSQATGIKFKPDGVPDFSDPEEIEIHFGINDKEREEILMEKLTTFVLENNKWFPFGKRNILTDMWDGGYACAWNYVNPNGKICIENIRLESLVHGVSYKDDFSDCGWIGHMIRMNVSEFRIMFPYVKEREIFDIAKEACRGGSYGNDNFTYTWNEDFISSYARPYDDVKFDIMYGWYKVDKLINYVTGTDSYGRKILDVQKEIGEIKNPRKQGKTKRIKTAYTGFWIVNTNYIYDWREERNQLRPYNNLEDVLPPYVINMPGNSDGTMLPISPQSMIKPYIRHMDECIFKIRQIIAKAAPDGYIVNMDALEELDLGVGVGTKQPLDVETIYRQTGIWYTRGRNKDSGEPIENPITPLQTNFGGKLSELVQIYNFNLQQIRDVLGINEYREGQGVNPKLGLGVLQTQLAASNNATIKYYNGYVEILKQTARAVAQRLWDSLWFSTKNGYGAAKEYLDLIGKDNKEFLQAAKDLTKSNYDIDIQIGLNSEERQRLEENIQQALTNGSITLDDALFVRDIKDYRMAVKYLAMKQRKRAKEAMDAQRETQELQAQLNERQAQVSAKNEAKIEQLKQSTKIQEQQVSGEYKLKEEDKKFLHSILLKQYETGQPLPDYAVQLLEKYKHLLDMEEQQMIEQMQAEQEAAQQPQLAAQQSG